MKEPIIRRIIFARATQRSFKNCIILAGHDCIYFLDLFCDCIRTFRYIYIYLYMYYGTIFQVQYMHCLQLRGFNHIRRNWELFYWLWNCWERNLHNVIYGICITVFPFFYKWTYVHCEHSPCIKSLFKTRYDGLNHIHSRVSFRKPLERCGEISHLPYEPQHAAPNHWMFTVFFP